jgi:hypothetical protein
MSLPARPNQLSAEIKMDLASWGYERDQRAAFRNPLINSERAWLGARCLLKSRYAPGKSIRACQVNVCGSQSCASLSINKHRSEEGASIAALLRIQLQKTGLCVRRPCTQTSNLVTQWREENCARWTCMHAWFTTCKQQCQRHYCKENLSLNGFKATQTDAARA